ncbi:hypothetical protein B566_EDAN002534 [Ephemera danica]|nr:hypothetical protein B566_EDAN002534 [Ephemera danica]
MLTTDIFKKGVVKSPRLALNCVGGKNALEVMRHLAFRGEIVTYGGMSREPLTVSTAALIFKDLRVRGYWMTQWNKEHIGSQQWSEMINDITSMILAKQLKPPIHKVVSIDNFTEALGNTMNPKGFAGCKYILRM